MDITTLIVSAVIAFLVPTFCGGLVWLIKLQPTISGLKSHHVKYDLEIQHLTDRFERHKDNGDIHFNEKVSREVDKRNEQRFITIEKQLSEISTKIDKLPK